MAFSWPPHSIPNALGTCTLSLGNWRHHDLPNRLREAARAGYQYIDLFDEDWGAYISAQGQDPATLWTPTPANLALAKQLGDLIKSLGMRIACTQPLRAIEGIKDPIERAASLKLVAARFPFMRAFDTDLVFMCASIRRDAGVTSDFKTVARDLAEIGDMAAAYALADGGPMIRVGYEPLSWAVRNTWASAWEVVRAANRENVGLIMDSFNLLAVEFADPYNSEGHGRIYGSLEESIDVLKDSLSAFVASVPGDRIFFVQLGDAELVDPKTFHPPTDESIPKLLPWSRGHRLFPMETERGAYMPVDLVTAAILATGYSGPISLEVFNHSLNKPDESVPREHAERGYTGLEKLVVAVKEVPQFWDSVAPTKVWRTRSKNAKVNDPIVQAFQGFSQQETDSSWSARL